MAIYMWRHVTPPIDFLLIGGGGGGGGGDYPSNHSYGGGGGGAGGVVQMTGIDIDDLVGTYNIVIGQGGTGGLIQAEGSDGGNSTFGSYIAYGGGGGGKGYFSGTVGHNGGSGGGGGKGSGGGTGTAGQGNNGGGSTDVGGGGGGGGAGGAGGGGGWSSGYGVGGNGGVGIQSDISGVSTWYAGGGGGGGQWNGTGGSGSNSYGGGGQGTDRYAGNGQPGIFILRYSTLAGYNITGGTVTTVGGYSIHTFTESGILTISNGASKCLCFTANTAGSTVQLSTTNRPRDNEFEVSNDGTTRENYTLRSEIALSNVGDKVYFRNKNNSAGLSRDRYENYNFIMSGSISASGNLIYLLRKDGETPGAIPNYCFSNLFANCSALTSSPILPNSNTVNAYAYYRLFHNCVNLETLPIINNLIFEIYACQLMFQGCSKIKLSETQVGEYQTEYRIPITGTGTTASDALTNMFYGTGGTFTGTPTINTTYYTSNTLV